MADARLDDRPNPESLGRTGLRQPDFDLHDLAQASLQGGLAVRDNGASEDLEARFAARIGITQFDARPVEPLKPGGPDDDAVLRRRGGSHCPQSQGGQCRVKQIPSYQSLSPSAVSSSYCRFRA